MTDPDPDPPTDPTPPLDLSARDPACFDPSNPHPLKRDIGVRQLMRSAVGIPCLKAGEDVKPLQAFDLAEPPAQAALGERDDFIKFMSDSVPGLLSYWSPEMRCTFANKNYLNWFGLTAQQMQGITLRELAGNDALYRKREPYLRAALRGEPQAFEATRTTATGELMHLWIQHIPHITEGVVRGCLALVTDITDVKRDQQELRIAAVAFESDESMMVTDASTIILRVNRAFTHITGYSAEESVGQTPRFLSSGRHQSDFYRSLWESIQRTGSWQGEVWNRRKNGEVYPSFLTISAVYTAEGEVTHYVGIHHDITERKRLEEQVRQLAFYDPLTKLPNRRLLGERLNQVQAESKRSGCYGALMFLDLDNFKPLNDKHGHVVGDLLLIDAAHRLQGCVRQTDTVARFGGDEFVVMLHRLTLDRAESTLQAGRVAQKLAAALSAPYLLTIKNAGAADTAVHHHCTASIGVAVFTDGDGSQDDWLQWADAAMYQAKEAGRNAIRFFEAKTRNSAALKTLASTGIKHFDDPGMIGSMNDQDSTDQDATPARSS